LARSKPNTSGRISSGCAAGFSLIELVFVVSLGITIAAAALPQLTTGLDELRTAGAAQYVSARFHRARTEAVLRSSSVAVVFASDAAGYTFAVYVDGNGNGVLARDISRGVDRRLGPIERLSEQFPGVEFGAIAGLPPIDAGGTPPGTDPIRLGTANSASFAPVGSATAGTVYVRGAGGAQYAVRIYGDTGRTRRLKFDRAAWQWRAL
jgi:type II secretory pathway pseudopilin PulG